MGFKNYCREQLQFFPYDLEDMVEQNHVVRSVDQVVDNVYVKSLLRQYSDVGTPPYDPRMLLKVIIYAYINNTYSSRDIEKKTKRDIHFMWLSAMNRPDHNTINRFRSTKLKHVIKEVFSQVVIALAKKGIIDLQEQYLDGTTMEANANRYTFVWGKNVRNNIQKIQNRLEELWQYTEKVAADEVKTMTKPDLEKLDPEEVQQTADKINEVLKKQDSVDKKVKAKAVRAKQRDAKQLRKYQDQLEQMGEGRNSYSKTDSDATFMRTKDDHLGKSQLKPAYNLQLSTNKQFITNYSLHRTPADSITLIPHLESHKDLYGEIPNKLIADAAYGSEENYHYLEKENVEAYVKYNSFDKERGIKGKKKTEKRFDINDFGYDPENDRFICPAEQFLFPILCKKRKTRTGYERKIVVYQAQNCSGCPLKSACYKGEGNKILEVSNEFIRYKEKAKKLLLSDKGITLMKQRSIDVESVFGMIKHNRKFNRFMLRNLEKVGIEAGLLAIAHNLKKMVVVCCSLDLKPKMKRGYCFLVFKFGCIWSFFQNLIRFWTLVFQPNQFNKDFCRNSF